MGTAFFLVCVALALVITTIISSACEHLLESETATEIGGVLVLYVCFALYHDLRGLLFDVCESTIRMAGYSCRY